MPIGSTKKPEFLDPLNPGEPFSVGGESYTVVSVGDNPTFREELTEAFENIVKAFARIVTFWREHEGNLDETQEVIVRVKIENKGPNDLRVILGNNLNDEVLPSGQSSEFVAPEYIEVRELGV